VGRPALVRMGKEVTGMMRFRRFATSGTYFEDGRETVLASAPFIAWIPVSVVVPLLQHEGVEAKLAVTVGQTVKEGSVIGSTCPSGVAVHAPIPGVVKDVRQISLADGRVCTGVQIDLGGDFSFFQKHDSTDQVRELPANKLLDTIRAAGIPGDIRYPDLADALESARRHSVPAIIIDVVEAGPHNMVDHALVAYEPKAVSRGLEIVRRLLGAERVAAVVASDYEKQANAFLSDVASHTSGFQVVLASPRYPNSDAARLVQLATRKQIRANEDPIENGCIILRPEQLFQVYEAVDLNHPCIETWLTVSGPVVEHPQVVRARIGTPIWQILEDIGGIRDVPKAIVIGDPMRGYSTLNVELPVTKETRSLVLLDKVEQGPVPEIACIHCGDCVKICPVGLEPERLYKLLSQNAGGKARTFGLTDCTGCGLCSWTCPSQIPLAQIFRRRNRQSRAVPNAGDVS